MQSQKFGDSQTPSTTRSWGMRRACLRIWKRVVSWWTDFLSSRRTTRKSDLEWFVEQPWSVGIEGIVRRSHQEDAVRVIDEIELTGVSISTLRGTDD